MYKKGSWSLPLGYTPMCGRKIMIFWLEKDTCENAFKAKGIGTFKF